MDWYTIESSEVEIDYSQKDDMYVRLNSSRFEIYCSGVTLTIGLHLSETEYLKLDEMLRSEFKDKIVMTKE